MITIFYELDGLHDALRGLEQLVQTASQRLEDELSHWSDVFLATARGRVFYKDEQMRRIDRRRAGQPRLRDFWKSEIEQIDYGAALEIWNEHPNMAMILFPTSEHRIPFGGAPAMKAKGYPLRWYDYRGEMHTQWASLHPGTPGQPVHLETWDRLESIFEGRLEALADDFVRIVTEG